MQSRVYLFIVDAMNKADEESEELQQKFMEKEIETAVFVQKYKKLRSKYHKRALIHLAAKTSSIGWNLKPPKRFSFFLDTICK